MLAADLLPRASMTDVLTGRGALVGSRLAGGRRGWISPIEARVAMGLSYGDLASEEAEYLRRRTPWSDAGVLVRGCLVRWFAPGGRSPSQARPFIVSARVDNLTADAALVELLRPSSTERARMVHFVHAHALNIAAVDGRLRSQLRRADIVLPDGIGLRLAAALLGRALVHNLNGTDLFPLMCSAAARHSIPLVFVGAAPGVAAECARRMTRRVPGLRVPIVSHGYLDERGARALARRVSRLGRCMVLVGMGTPRQEAWAWEHLAGIDRATVVTVGGLFDFYSGRIPRAPEAWREIGLEWLYRMIREPRRLAARNLAGIPAFVARAVLQRLRREAR